MASPSLIIEYKYVQSGEEGEDVIHPLQDKPEYVHSCCVVQAQLRTSFLARIPVLNDGSYCPMSAFHRYSQSFTGRTFPFWDNATARAGNLI